MAITPIAGHETMAEKDSENKNQENKNVGLAIMRIQPLHKGHCKIISEMIQNCEIVIIGVGSAQLNNTFENPWRVDDRLQMIKNVFGKRVKTFPLEDLGAESGTNGWVDYVLDKVDKLGLPAPNEYWTGSDADSLWYKGRFLKDGKDLINMSSEYKTDDGRPRVIKGVERSENSVPSATELRTYLQLRNPEWKQWIPRVNHRIVEEGFPEQFRVPSQ